MREKNQVKKDKRNIPEYVKEPAQMFRGMGLSDAHKRICSHLIYFTYDGTKEFTTSTRDLQELLEWKTKDKVEEALANLTVRRMIHRTRTPRGTVITWNSKQDEWIRDLKEVHWIDALNHGTVAKGHKAKNIQTKISVRKTRTLECPKNQDTECPKNQDTEIIECPKNQDRVSEKQGHSLTYLEEGNKERSKKEGIYKKAEQSLDFENSVETPLEVQDFLASWRAYIFSHSADFKVNANAVWGNGIRHAEAIAKLLASGEKLIDIDMVFNYWKSGKTWFESCLTPADLIREKNGQSVYTRLFFGAKRALSKNAQYQLRSGIMNVIEAEKNGTLHDAPF